ncbi:hypothetical protein BX661DRAFT_187453 [Kickxella alabastrina]|uniref:uncharacterized protein n=1 Tax=Kickxella alabastrina TaxID=61397 RepID=UPI002220DF93|nr:uncharacterized protein BX661DRAFT_187453 [Kickxella alabastrina]KAI7822471.1 hypothetical protein BX661DRAFT_187453 [Kickxella alabastrina]
MVKLTAQDKVRIKQVQEIEAQLRASANGASDLVNSWLGDESDNENQSKPNSAPTKARDIFKGRPARLGVGAKFLSHKEMMSNMHSGPGILTAEELSLKRRLSKGITTENLETKKKNNEDEKNKKREEKEESDDDGDSRSKMVSSMVTETKAAGKQGSVGDNKLAGGEQLQMKKRKTKTTEFLDSLVKRRKR